MELGEVSIKQLSELEQQITQLLKTMRNAKLNEDDVYTQLQKFEQDISKERRERFDENNSRYNGY